jgi:pyridoxine/pyridoxamine 5'-phosphate oxidase
VTAPDLRRFVAQCKLGVLSSIASSGTPQSALVGIAVTENLEVIFDTLKTSRKYSNLIARPTCSFVFGWAGEQTVQYEGRRT